MPNILSVASDLMYMNTATTSNPTPLCSPKIGTATRTKPSVTSKSMLYLPEFSRSEHETFAESNLIPV